MFLSVLSSLKNIIFLSCFSEIPINSKSRISNQINLCHEIAFYGIRLYPLMVMVGKFINYQFIGLKMMVLDLKSVLKVLIILD